jgi:transposase InsO family protein
VESSRPGELLCQDTFFVGQFKGVGKVYLHTVVDTYRLVCFGRSGHQQAAGVGGVRAVQRRAALLPGQGITVSAVLTDNGREFCGKEAQHPYELFLALSDIEHRRTKSLAQDQRLCGAFSPHRAR